MAVEYYVCVIVLAVTMDISAVARKQNPMEIEVPFGAMFDHSARGAQAAMEYKLSYVEEDEQNETRISLKSIDSNHFLNMNDVYSTNTEFCRLVKRGVFGMFGTHTAETLDALIAYTGTFHMPFLTPRIAVDHTDSAYIVYMQPMYAKAIVDMFKHYEWKEIWYIHSTNEGLIRMQQIFDALAKADYILRINVIRVNDARDFVVALASIHARWKEKEKRIVLDMSLSECEQALRIVHDEHKSPLNHFFVVPLGLSELNLTFFEHGGMNITGFRMFDATKEQTYIENWKTQHQRTFSRMGQRLSHEAALTIDGIAVLRRALALLKVKHNTLFTQYMHQHSRPHKNGSNEMNCETETAIPWKLGHLLIQAIKEINFSGLTGPVFFDRHGNRRKFELGVLETTTSMALSDIGDWKHGPGLVISSPSIIRAPGSNMLANRSRIITTIGQAPYLMEHPPELNYVGNDRYYGYAKDLAEKVCALVRVKCVIRIVGDGQFGQQLENGSWNGMMGEIIREEADLAIAPLSITAVRERYIDFSKPFMSLGINIMIKKPEKEVPGVFSFMYPLSYEIWMCVIFAYIGVSVVLFLVSRFSPFEWHIEDNTDGPTVTNNFTIFNSLWFALGAFMQQGCDIEPRSMSGRIVGSMWWFFTLIIISSYTANLAAFLTTQRMKSPIESADDLAKQTEIKYGTVLSGTTKEFFKTSSIPTYERMWAFMDSTDPPVFVKSNKEGVDRVRNENGRYAFLMESTTIDYHNQRQPCDTMKVGANLDSKGYGIGTPLGSDLRHQVTMAVLELRENGDLTKLETKWWIKKGECGPPKGQGKQETTNALKIENVAGIFYILIGGLALGLVSAASEFMYNSKMESKRRQTTFMTAARSKAHLSLKGEPEKHTSAVGAPIVETNPADLPPNLSMSTYTYTPAAQLITFDGYADANTHTQV